MRTKVKRALLSVYDKAGLVEFVRGLHDLGVELISSGNTSAALEAEGIPVTRVESVTGSPEILDGRVKTLHPKIHGGLLADLGNDTHRNDLDVHGILPFELVVSNLYPFEQRPDIETIDIGGPAMTRAAAKNHAWVTIVTDPSQYGPLLEELHANDGTVGPRTRRAFAVDAFARTAAYDAAIVQWLETEAEDDLPRHLVLALARTDEQLRYGENPHQRAARYRRANTTSWWDGIVQHGGLALSYLNFYDTDAAWQLAHDLGDRAVCAIIKHANPCGVAVDDARARAYQRALECDEQSAFGGVVALNRALDDATVARMVAGPQADVVIAPGYEEGTIAALQKKRRNTRILEAPAPGKQRLDVRQVSGGFLVQDAPHLRVDAQRLAGCHEGRADTGTVERPRVRVARVRTRQVQRDRARQGRAGRRHRRRAAEARRLRGDRDEEGRRPRARRRVARATRSIHSRTASKRRPRLA